MSIIAGTAIESALGGYQIDYGLRFNSADSAYLNRTPGNAGNLKTWTWSAWIKRSYIDSSNDITLFGATRTSDGFILNISIKNDGEGSGLQLFQNSPSIYLRSSAAFRDPSAWYHIVVAVDTTQATNTNRVKMYVNGVQITSFNSPTYPSQDDDTYVNNTYVHDIGVRNYLGSRALYMGGYMAEMHHVDGSALDPTSFGSFNATTGVWQPKKYSGSYGTNGFYLPFNEPIPTVTASIMAIAGGGGGGHGDGSGTGGGGGAGGLIYTAAATLLLGTSYTVTVGGGGGSESTGSNSKFASATANGGGAGGYTTGGSGGCGGGGGTNSFNDYRAGGSATQTSPTGFTGYGYAGGNRNPQCGGAGGGGTGAAGQNAVSFSCGSGGVGRDYSSVFGSTVGESGYFGGGGGGGAGCGGGLGGGGDAGVNSQGQAGAANTGGGGGGTHNAGAGGSGGSGVVLIKIPDTHQATFSGGVTYSTITSVSGYNIYHVTATSTTSETVSFSAI